MRSLVSEPRGTKCPQGEPQELALGTKPNLRVLSTRADLVYCNRLVKQLTFRLRRRMIFIDSLAIDCKIGASSTS